MVWRFYFYFLYQYICYFPMHQKTGYVSKSRAVHLRKEEHICIPFLWYLVMAKYFTRQKTEHPKHGYLIRRDVNIICLSLVSTTCFWHKTNFCNVTEKTKSRDFYSHHCLWIIYYGDNKANKIISVYLDCSSSRYIWVQLLNKVIVKYGPGRWLWCGNEKMEMILQYFT